jgi:hypothetical protein
MTDKTAKSNRREVAIEESIRARIFYAQLVSTSPLSFGRHYDFSTAPKLSDKESADSYEMRTWRERCHYDAKSLELFIPPTWIKNSITSAAAHLSIKIPGKRNATYTKHFQRGLLCTEPIMLGVHKDKVDGETYFVPSDGKRGSSSRVNKRFPVVYQWAGVAQIQVIDDEIPEEVFARVIAEAGRTNGFGRFRPQCEGYYGRYVVRKLEVETFDGQ